MAGAQRGSSHRVPLDAVLFCSQGTLYMARIHVCIQKSVMTRCVKEQGKKTLTKTTNPKWRCDFLHLFYCSTSFRSESSICGTSSTKLPLRPDRFLVQDNRKIRELVSFSPLLLWGWASLLITLSLHSPSVAQEERVLFSQWCALPSLSVWWVSDGWSIGRTRCCIMSWECPGGPGWASLFWWWSSGMCTGCLSCRFSECRVQHLSWWKPCWKQKALKYRV